jgi:hypothetical protein
MKKLIILSAVGLAMMVLAGFPYISYGDMIYGCYQKNNGQLRIVGNTSECKKSEVPISWAGGLAGPTTILVDCNNGETITDALQQLGDPLTIQVKGTCNENVEIVRNDVTLIAHPSGGTINGPDPNKITINVRGSPRTVIDGLTVTGGRTGINGSAMIRNCTIQNNAWNGVSFYHGGNGTVDSCRIKDNPHHGIVIEGGSATVINSTISSNGGVGIIVNPGGSARIGITDRNEYAGNTISNNGSNGIHVAGGSAFIGGNTISGNGTDPNARWGRHGIGFFYGNGSVVGYNRITGNPYSGIIAKSSAVMIGDGGFGLLIGAPGEDPMYANVITGNNMAGTPDNGGVYGYLGASLDIRYSTISNNTGDGVILRLRSTARMYGDTINENSGNGILLDQGGGVRLQGPLDPYPVPAVTATDNGSGLALQCFGGESSFLGGFAAGSDPVSGSCNGF